MTVCTEQQVELSCSDKERRAIRLNLKSPWIVKDLLMWQYGSLSFHLKRPAPQTSFRPLRDWNQRRPRNAPFIIGYKSTIYSIPGHFDDTHVHELHSPK